MQHVCDFFFSLPPSASFQRGEKSKRDFILTTVKIHEVSHFYCSEELKQFRNSDLDSRVSGVFARCTVYNKYMVFFSCPTLFTLFTCSFVCLLGSYFFLLFFHYRRLAVSMPNMIMNIIHYCFVISKFNWETWLWDELYGKKQLRQTIWMYNNVYIRNRRQTLRATWKLLNKI